MCKEQISFLKERKKVLKMKTEELSNVLFANAKINDENLWAQLMRDNFIRGVYTVTCVPEFIKNSNDDDAVRITFFLEDKQLCYITNTIQYASNDIKNLLKIYGEDKDINSMEELALACNTPQRVSFYVRKTKNDYTFQSFKKPID